MLLSPSFFNLLFVLLLLCALFLCSSVPPQSASVKLAKSPSDGRVFVLVNFSRQVRPARCCPQWLLSPWLSALLSLCSIPPSLHPCFLALSSPFPFFHSCFLALSSILPFIRVPLQAVIKLYGAMDDTAAVGGRWVAVDHASGTEFSGSVRLVETVPGEDGEAEDEDDEPDFATAAAALGITMSSLEGETAPATGDDFASKSSSTGTAGGAGAGMAAVAEDHDHDHDEDSKREDERAAEEAVVAARMAAAAAAAAASGGAVPDAASAAATAAALAGAAPAAGAGSSAAGSAGAGAGAGDDAASRQKALTARFQSQRALFRKVSHRSGLAAAVAEVRLVSPCPYPLAPVPLRLSHSLPDPVTSQWPDLLPSLPAPSPSRYSLSSSLSPTCPISLTLSLA